MNLKIVLNEAYKQALMIVSADLDHAQSVGIPDDRTRASLDPLALGARPHAGAHR